MSTWPRIRRLTAGASLLLAPLFWLALMAVAPARDGDDGAAALAVAARDGDAAQASTLLAVVALLLFVPALVSAIHLLRHHAPLLGYVGGGLALLGGAAAFALLSLDVLALEAVSVGVDREDAATLYDAVSGNAVFGLVTGVFVIGHIVGTTLLGVGLVRSRIVPVWAGAAVAVSQVVHAVAVAGAGKPLEIAGAALLAAGLGTVGVSVLRMPDAEWDARATTTHGRGGPADDVPRAVARGPLRADRT